MPDQPYTFRLSPMQPAIEKVLKAHPYFEDITVLTEQKGDIANEIDRALGSMTETQEKAGICVVVLTPTASVSSPNSPGPKLDPCAVVVSVIENVLINQSDTGTKKPAIQVVEMIMRVLHRRVLAECNSALASARQAMALKFQDPLEYHVNFEAMLVLKPENQ